MSGYKGNKKKLRNREGSRKGKIMKMNKNVKS